MSSTNRGSERMLADNYPTPAWCVKRMLEAFDLPLGMWLEPAAGDGAIVRAANEFLEVNSEPVYWTGVDVRNAPLHSHPAQHFICADFLTHDFGDRRFDVAISNPPYSIAQPFIEKCLGLADVTAMLLRLNYLGSERRAAFMRSNPPDVYVLPNRPAFVNGKTDSCEYAWFVWGQGGGRVRMLNTTPAAERRQG